MATGDNYFSCDPKLGTEQVIRDMIYDDGEGNPVLHTNPSGTSLEKYFNCNERKCLSLEQVFRMMILSDENESPYLNTTSS